MNQPSGDQTTTNPAKTTRRRFVEVAGTVSSVGVAGCLGLPNSDSAESGSPDGPTVDTTLFATWREPDPATSTTLQWLTTAQEPPDPVSVELSPVGGGSDHSVETRVAGFGDENLFRHRAAVTGLEPSTSYRIDIRDTEQSPLVETPPDTVSESLTFAEGGDVGTSVAVSRLHEQAASWDPLFAVVGGDLAYANGQNADRWVRFLETWHEEMRVGDRLIPLVAAIGNHEVQSGMHGNPDEAPFFYTLFDNVVRERAYWALDFGEFLSILLLDSNHTTPVAGAQTAWLEEALAARENVSHVLPVYHVPAYPSAKPLDARDREDIREHWVPLFEQYDVDVCFEHDDHTYKRTHLLEGGEPVDTGGVRYVGDGAWGKGPRPVKSPEDRSYLQRSASKQNVIRVTLTLDGRKQLLAVDPDGEKIDEFEL